MIDELQSSQDADCKALGNSARARFESEIYGFEIASLDGDDYGIVEYRPIPMEPEAPLAEYTTGITWLDPINWENGELGRTVLHEEIHHAGDPDDMEGELMAYYCFPE